jgi:hypothetical protein
MTGTSSGGSMSMIKSIVGLAIAMGFLAGSAFGTTFECEMVVRDGISYQAPILAQSKKTVPGDSSSTLHAAGYRSVVNLSSRDDRKAYYIEVAYDVEGFPALSYQSSPTGLSHYAHGSIDRQKERHITVECNRLE